MSENHTARAGKFKACTCTNSNCRFVITCIEVCHFGVTNKSKVPICPNFAVDLLTITVKSNACGKCKFFRRNSYVCKKHDCVACLCSSNSSLYRSILNTIYFCNKNAIILCSESTRSVCINVYVFTNSKRALCNKVCVVSKRDSNSFAFTCINLNFALRSESCIIKFKAYCAFGTITMVIIDPNETGCNSCIFCIDMTGIDVEVVCVNFTAVHGKFCIATHNECFAVRIECTCRSYSCICAVPDLVTAKVTFNNNVNVIAVVSEPNYTVCKVEVYVLTNCKSIVVSRTNCKVI